MNDFFKTIQTDIEQLEASLAYQIPFFRYDGNVYLIADNKFKSLLLLREYEKLCKLNLTFEDIQKLKPIAKSYRNLLAMLALEMQKDFKKDEDLKLALDKTDLDLSGNLLIKKFAQIKQQVQRLLTELNTYLISSYSLKSIPVVTIQENLQKNIDKFNFLADEVDVILELDSLKSNGLPDLEKIKTHEQNTNFLKIEIAVQSEIMQKLDLFNLASPDEYEIDMFEDMLAVVLEQTYRPIHTFAYEQLFKNGIPAREVVLNVKAKSPNIKNDLATKIETALNLIAQDFKSIDLDQQFLTSGKQFLKNYNKFVKEQQLFDPVNPKFYDLELRESNEFEKQTYGAYLACDVYFAAGLYNTDKLITNTFAIVPSPKVYELGAILICGSGYNQPWKDNIFSDYGLTALGKLEQKIKGNLNYQEEEVLVERQFLNNISDE